MRAYIDRSTREEPYVRILPAVTVLEATKPAHRPKTLEEARALLGNRWALSPEREPKIRRKVQ